MTHTQRRSGLSSFVIRHQRCYIVTWENASVVRSISKEKLTDFLGFYGFIKWWFSTDSMLRPLQCQMGPLRGCFNPSLWRLCEDFALQKRIEVPCISMHDISCLHCLDTLTIKNNNQENLMGQPYPSIWIKRLTHQPVPNPSPSKSVEQFHPLITARVYDLDDFQAAFLSRRKNLQRGLHVISTFIMAY